MNLAVPPLYAYSCRVHVAKFMALLYRIRIGLLFISAASLLYACGVWDMLNEVSIRENNGISWPVSPISLLAKYKSVNRSSTSTQYLQFGDAFSGNSSKTTSLVSSAVAFYRSFPPDGTLFPAPVGFGNASKSLSSNNSSFSYSTTFYYIETHKKISSSKKHRARTEQQGRRMAILPQQQRMHDQVSLPLHVDNRSHAIGSITIGKRPWESAKNDSIVSHSPDANHESAASNSREDSGDDSNSVVDERQRAFMVVYQVSSGGNSHNRTALDARDPNQANFMRMLEAADADTDDDDTKSGYSPTATPSPLPPDTMSLQPTPLPEITSSYFTSTIAGATNPTIREPHNYGENSLGSSTTRKTYYRPISSNNTRRFNIDSSVMSGWEESEDSDADDSDASSANDNSWRLRPMKLTSALNISNFPFMQYIISSRCPLPLYDVPASERNAVMQSAEAFRIDSVPKFADAEHATRNDSMIVRHPNCAEAFAADGKYTGYNRTSTGSRRVLIIVKSAQAHFDRRAVIRQTWGSHPQLIVRFLIGRAPVLPVTLPAIDDTVPSLVENDTMSDGDSFSSWIHQAFATFLRNDTNISSRSAVSTSTARPNQHAQRSAPEALRVSDVQQSRYDNETDAEKKTSFDCAMPDECKLLGESRQYDDIILTNFVDNYYNNTFKTLSGIHWAVQFCRLGSVEYVLLSDDDMWLNPFNLLEYLENATRNGSISADRDLYMGDLFPNSKPMRIRWSKWYVPVSVYKFDRYPPYITASAILMSRSTLIKFAEESLHTELFMYDDIFLAILARQLGINATRNPLFSSFNRVDVFDQTQTDLFSSLVVSHGYGQPSTLSHAWNTTVCQRLFAPSFAVMPHERYRRTTLLPDADGDRTSRSQVSLSSIGPATSLWRWIYSSLYGDADRPAPPTPPPPSDAVPSKSNLFSSSNIAVKQHSSTRTRSSTPPVIRRHGS